MHELYLVRLILASNPPLQARSIMYFLKFTTTDDPCTIAVEEFRSRYSFRAVACGLDVHVVAGAYAIRGQGRRGTILVSSTHLKGRQGAVRRVAAE